MKNNPRISSASGPPERTTGLSSTDSFITRLRRDLQLFHILLISRIFQRLVDVYPHCTIGIMFAMYTMGNGNRILSRGYGQEKVML